MDAEEAHRAGMLWDWKAQVYITKAEWEARQDAAPNCSPSCKKQPTGKGHRRDCRRMKALVAVGVMHPDVLKLRSRKIKDGA